MKTLLLIALVATLASCKKDEPAVLTPSITSLHFRSFRDAGKHRPQFVVSMVTDPRVATVSLYLVPEILVEQRTNPTTGQYIMYDYYGLFPVKNDNVFYFFEFGMTDGTVIRETPFQVF